jgi:thiamine-phosphate pyrophosphorylase
MASRLLYYITDRSAFPGDEPARCRQLVKKIGEAARAGVDYIQLREKDLPSRDLELLAKYAVDAIRPAIEPGTSYALVRTRLLINSRADVALASGAAGTHLRSNDISPAAVHDVWKRSKACDAASAERASDRGELGALARNPSRREGTISVSCHSQRDVAHAAERGADLAIFAPVFGKKDSPGTPAAGLEALRRACRPDIPVLALGGITLENARSCFEAGAAGIAAIRLFQENDIAEVVQVLHRL